MLHIIKRQLRHAEHPLGVWQNGVTQLGQRDRRRGTVDQFTAEHGFDLPQGAAECRLADGQFTGGIRKMTQLRQSDKIL